tara:strand:+ start:6347 stop:7516 length:1170 start_codon:yes stop_codon:yes gene_type:complete
MHCLEKYALACNALIDTPHLEGSFFPLPFDKYITLDLGAEFNHRQYPFFQDVIHDILPVLQANSIHIIQLGDPRDPPLQGVYYLNNRTQVGHANYLLKNSLLHISSQSFSANVANCLKTPQVLIYEKNEIDLCGPSWDRDSLDLFLHKGAPRPSLGAPTKTISVLSVYPEKIAKKILNNLSLDSSFLNYETLYIGDSYIHNALEVIPNFNAPNNAYHKTLVNIRGDLGFNEQAIASWCNCERKIAIKLPAVFNFNFLQHIKNFIHGTSYEIHMDTSMETLQQLKSLGKDLRLYSCEENLDALKELRLKFLNFSIEQDIKTTEKSLDISEDIDYTSFYFKSSKKILSNNQIFESLPLALQGVQAQAEPLIINSPQFWEDLKFYKIYKKNG